MTERYSAQNPIEWLSMYALVIVGFAFAIWAGYHAYTEPNIYHALGSVIGFMCGFNQLDRNVYYKRIRNLASTLQDSECVDFTIRRVNYTDYEIECGGEE